MMYLLGEQEITKQHFYHYMQMGNTTQQTQVESLH